jgi:hypothetical protein
VVLLAAAVSLAVRSGEFGSAMSALGRAGWGTLVALALLPVVNWLLTSAVFAVLTGRYGRVRFGEMAALIGSAWVLNLLPMRPGMIGRVAYHKVLHGIRVRDSAAVLVAAMACSAAAAVALACSAVAAATWRAEWTWAAAVVPALAAAMAAAWMRRHRPGGAPWRLVAAMGLRCADVLVWALRYWLVFEAIGRPLSSAAAVVIAGASQAAMAVPVQVGVREWIVGLASGVLPPWLSGRTGMGEGVVGAAAPGLAADLVNRAVELAVLIPVGVVCAVWLWGHRTGGVGAAGGDEPIQNTDAGWERSPPPAGR